MIHRRKTLTEGERERERGTEGERGAEGWTGGRSSERGRGREEAMMMSAGQRGAGIPYGRVFARIVRAPVSVAVRWDGARGPCPVTRRSRPPRHLQTVTAHGNLRHDPNNDQFYLSVPGRGFLIHMRSSIERRSTDEGSEYLHGSLRALNHHFPSSSQVKPS